MYPAVVIRLYLSAAMLLSSWSHSTRPGRAAAQAGAGVAANMAVVASDGVVVVVDNSCHIRILVETV